MCGTAQTESTQLPLVGQNQGCACCASPSDTVAATPIDESAIQETYLVEGMTCGHCASSVTKELTAIPGVEGVHVELVAGGASRVSVTSTLPIDPDTIRSSVNEAGYQLAHA